MPSLLWQLYRSFFNVGEDVLLDVLDIGITVVCNAKHSPRARVLTSRWTISSFRSPIYLLPAPGVAKVAESVTGTGRLCPLSL